MYPGRSEHFERLEAQAIVKGAASLALLCALILPPAQAQDLEDPTIEPNSAEADSEAFAEAQSSPGRPVIEEIIVTATKREVSVRDVAGSVTALTGDELEDDGLQDIGDIVDAVPGVNIVENNVGFKRITMRGIAAGNLQNETTGVFIDETPFTDVFWPVVSADANPFDMSAVEVIKGPVGTLFGGSALNGAIRYLPQQPVMGEWQAKAFTEYRINRQSEDVGRISGVAVNVPIFESLALRLTGNDRYSQGTIDSVNQSYKAKDVDETLQHNVRAILRWQPLERLDASIMYLHQDTRILDFGFADNCCSALDERAATAQPSPSHGRYHTWQLKGSWRFDWADVVVAASDSDKRFDNLFDGSFIAEADPGETTVLARTNSRGQPRSQELRVVSAPGGDWDWLAGLFNYKYNVFTDFGTANPNDATSVDVLKSNIEADVTEQAAFGELSWRFGPGFEVTGGVRLYEVSYLGEFVREDSTCPLVDPTCAVTGLRAELPLDKTERGVSPKLALKWTVSDQLLGYASASRGFRFGGVNGSSHPEIPRVYGSDFLWSYELGTRAEWFDGSLITDATLFMVDWTDAQLQTTTSDGQQVYIDNVGAVEGRGLEAQFIWQTPLPGLSLSLVPAYVLVQTAEDYTTPSSTGTGITTPAGTPWPRAPKWQTSAGVDWTGEVGDRQLEASLTHSYFGTAIQDFFPASPQVFGYATYNFQFAVKKIAGGWWPDLILNLNNLTDERGLTYSAAAPSGSALRSYAAPRSASLRLSFDL